MSVEEQSLQRSDLLTDCSQRVSSDSNTFRLPLRRAMSRNTECIRRQDYVSEVRNPIQFIIIELGISLTDGITAAKGQQNIQHRIGCGEEVLRSRIALLKIHDLGSRAVGEVRCQLEIRAHSCGSDEEPNEPEDQAESYGTETSQDRASFIKGQLLVLHTLLVRRSSRAKAGRSK